MSEHPASKEKFSSVTPWAAIGAYKHRRAHIWRESESNSFFARSNCGLSVLADQLRSPTGLFKCKVCEKAENANVG